MLILEVTIVLLLGALATIPIAQRLKIPIEVALLVESIFVSLLPIPEVSLSSEVALYLFLPPILFAAAYFTSWRDFKRYARPILLLAIGLVIFTTCGAAYLFKLLFPEAPWQVAFIFGAIISPPDASAAVTFVRQYNLPRRLITIVEGESLINDATALTCFRLALAAFGAKAFSIGSFAGEFAFLALGGLAVGIALAAAFIWLMLRLKNPLAEVLLSLLAPFFCYSIAEHLGFSGVLSTVACGAVFSRKIPVIVSSETRILAKGGWDLILFAINGLVFTLIGLQVPIVLRNLSSHSGKEVILSSVLIFLFLVVIRFVWVFPAAYIPRLISKKIRERDPYPSWQTLVTLSSFGMRGIVSLAAALSIPEFLENGEKFPFRELIILLSYGVIVLSLLIPSAVIPWMLSKFQLEGRSDHFREETEARIKLIESVLNMEADDNKIASQLRSKYQAYRERLIPNLSDVPFSNMNDDDRLLFKKQSIRFLKEERKALLKLRKEGKIHDEIFHRLEEEIDREEHLLRVSGRDLLLLNNQ